MPLSPKVFEAVNGIINCYEEKIHSVRLDKVFLLLSHLIFWVLKRLAPCGAKILSLLINPCHLAPKYLEHFIGSAPPLFILDLLLWIGSAHVSLYINSCFGLNKLLTNLILLHQHHLQYTGGLAETRGLLLPSLYCDALQHYSSDTYRQILVLFRTF